ncbi:type IV pilus assembly protein fimt [Isoalcanivorax pacificus W11-5]|uniref:Type II secretion system protein H n=2 Tax=Isoalcanivorax TaxID=3020833 RepID=A0A0B4XG72_9GAMM|nr:type IV pilus assembly protein fimt [Isoalcanivorax pacificus W11-5]
MKQTVAGMSLLEVLLCLVLLGWLSTYAWPAWVGLVERARVAQAQQQLQAALNYARFRAISLSSSVVVCPYSENGCAAPGDWSSGWLIYADPAGTTDCTAVTEGMCQEGGRVLAMTPLHDVLLVVNGNLQRRLRFDSTGMSPGYNGRFTFCSAKGRRSRKGLVISSVGRVRWASPTELLMCPPLS